jgi:UrcA family protein
MNITGKLLRGAALSVVSFACVAAYAESPPVEFQHSSTVRFSDLNLNRPQDVARLYNRITLVADKVCGPRTLTGAYAKSADYASCFGDAVAQAVAHVDQPTLTAYYRQRWAEPLPSQVVARQ